MQPATDGETSGRDAPELESAATAPRRGGDPVNVANAITLLRVAVIPVLVWLLYAPTPLSSFLAALLFAAASITDWLDGWLARKYGLQSALGAFLDPLADKLMVIAALVMLVALGRVGPILPIVIIARELIVTGLRSMAIEEGIVIAAGELGKYKMLLQVFALFALMTHHTWFGVNFHWGGVYYLWLATILAVWSGADYAWRFWRALRAEA